MNARNYREQLYRVRSHSALRSEGFYDQRDSFLTVYLSMIPFLLIEYMVELTYDVIPSGLIFPTGYLLFWAFYYTFYKPGFLEEKLSTPQKWDLIGIPAVLMGVLIWFVKVTVVELSTFFLRGLVRAPTPPRSKAERRTQPRSQWNRARTDSSYHQRASASNGNTGSYQQRAPGGNTGFHQMPPRPPPSVSVLPGELLHALHVLGLREGADWHRIHKRYRELAKQYHPDLNREVTDVGRRFMMYDAAYRKLSAAKARHFPERKS